MIPHEMYFRLKNFHGFWEQQLSIDKADRFVPHRHRWNILKSHERNMKKIGEILMSKKEKKKTKFEWKGYCNINILESHQSALEAYAADEKTVFYQYNALLVTNYQIKQYFDDYSESIKTVIVCHNPESSNFGFALTSYAEDWYTSIAVAMYKHYEIAQADWDNASSKTIRKFG